MILDELLRRRAREEMPLYLAYVATNGMIISWVNGDDAAFGRYLSALEDAVTPGLESGFAPLIDGARGRPVPLDEDHPWPVVTAMAQLYRLGAAATRASALDAARAAARAADRRRDPYTQILAHAALYVLDESARAHEAARLARDRRTARERRDARRGERDRERRLGRHPRDRSCAGGCSASASTSARSSPGCGSSCSPAA